jgi:hypothetical protein
MSLKLNTLIDTELVFPIVRTSKALRYWVAVTAGALILNVVAANPSI